MNTAAIIAFVTAGIAIIEQLVKLGVAGADLLAAVQAFHAKVRQIRDENRDPSDEEWAWLNSQIAADDAALNTDPAPLPSAPPVATPEPQPEAQPEAQAVS